MSSSYEYSYALEAKRRREVYLNRIRSTTENFYNHYKEQYQEMLNRGYRSYIPDEITKLENDLNQIKGLLISNPEEARDISIEVGSYIKILWSLGKNAKNKYSEAEIMRVEKIKFEREQHKNEILEKYFVFLNKITDPMVINYSIPAMQMLRKNIEIGNINNISILEEKMRGIIKDSEIKISNWKKEIIKKSTKEIVEKRLIEVEKRLNSEKTEDQEKKQKVINKINNIRLELEQDKVDLEKNNKKINDLEEEIDEVLISEDIRKETVIAIIKQLRKQDFTVEKPKFDGENYVKIVAKKPSGKRAICKVDISGKIIYKFDNYDGMTCLKDIEKFNVDLEKVYSIKLSDERLLWENPNKLSKTAKTISNVNRREL